MTAGKNDKYFYFKDFLIQISLMASAIKQLFAQMFIGLFPLFINKGCNFTSIKTMEPVVSINAKPYKVPLK